VCKEKGRVRRRDCREGPWKAQKKKACEKKKGAESAEEGVVGPHVEGLVSQKYGRVGRGGEKGRTEHSVEFLGKEKAQNTRKTSETRWSSPAETEMKWAGKATAPKMRTGDKGLG